MKYGISLVIGMLVGAALLVLFLYYNPLHAQSNMSPLSVTEKEVISLNYSAVAQDTLLYTNDGESQVKPHPVKVLQLWEPPIRLTTAMATVLVNSRNEVAGLGIKIQSASERTNYLNGRVLTDAIWHIYMPGRGSLFIEQTENHWGFMRNIVVPARWSSGDNWRGVWRGNITVGPTALETAKVAGGSGEFYDMSTEAVEALTARAYSVEHGPVAVEGELSIEIP